MSLKIEGCSCARCKAYLFSDDDIVYCPVCGAPHHRDCYNSLGRCALEELHGTDMEYSREKELEAQQKAEEKTKEQENTKYQGKEGYTVCSMCGEKYSADMSNCPECNAPNFSKMSGFVGFDLLGGVPADYKLDENVTADDAKKFVMANTQRYIPKFATLTPKRKISWNWMAFIFPCEWMLSRKMFKNGILTGLLILSITLLSIPFAMEISKYVSGDATSYIELARDLVEVMPQISRITIILRFLSATAELILRTVCALFGDYMYRNYTIASIQKIKSENDDINLQYRKRGGVTILWFMIGMMVLQYFPSILISII